jgi:hypothetical protein
MTEASPQPAPRKSSNALRIVGALAFIAVAGVVVLWMMQQYSGKPEAGFQTSQRVFIDSTTMKPFNHELQAGESIPVKAPSGGNTGYQAELCYWTKDGKVKDEPTPVLLNEAVGKPGPTFCPDCGRLVVGHNPRASSDATPPPTESEYKLPSTEPSSTTNPSPARDR